MRRPENPFIITGYHSPEYFCDREDETLQLLSNFTNGVNTTLTSIRRIGKTGLIKHVLGQLSKNWNGIYVDILPTENLSGFLNVLATSIVNAVPERESLGKKIMNFIKSLRPVFSYDVLTNAPQVSFNVNPDEAEYNIQSIFRFLSEQKYNVVIAIDEFQQILKYPEKNTDSWLRKIIQEMNNVRFIFSGSRQHLMNELFDSPSRPFYRSTSLLPLGKIPVEEYSHFIEKQFISYGRSINRNVIDEILKWGNLHTYYVQLLCNRVFASGKKVITSEVWREEAYTLLKNEEVFFINYRNLLTNPQWQLLKAVAAEGVVVAPTSKDFIGRHNLGSPSTVLRSLNSLIDKEMIYRGFNSAGAVYYSVYDVLFQRWAEHF